MNVKLNYEVNFSATMIENDQVFPNSFKVKLNITTATDNSHYQNVAFQRMVFFIEEIIDKSIMVNINHPDLEKFIDLWGTGRLVTTPDDPADQVIGIMLYHKLSAIAEGNFTIDSIEIGSSAAKFLTYTVDSFESSYTETAPAKKTKSKSTAHLYWWDIPDLTSAHVEQEIINLSWDDVNLAWDDDDNDDTEFVFIPEQKFKNPTIPNIIILDGGMSPESATPTPKPND